MENKIGTPIERKKLYKAGKLWVVASIAGVTFAAGAAVNGTQNVDAADNAPVTQTGAADTSDSTDATGQVTGQNTPSAAETKENGVAGQETSAQPQTDAPKSYAQESAETAAALAQKQHTAATYQAKRAIYDQQMDTYKQQLAQYNADTAENADTTGDYAKAIGDYQAKLTLYNQNHATWVNQVSDTIKANAALAKFNQAQHAYNAQLDAIAKAMEDANSSKASYQDKSSIYEANQAAYATAFQQYQAQVRTYEQFLKDNVSTTTDAQIKTLTDNYNAVKKAYDDGQKAATSITSNNKKTNDDNVAQKAAYDAKLAQYQKYYKKYQDDNIALAVESALGKYTLWNYEGADNSSSQLAIASLYATILLDPNTTVTSVTIDPNNSQKTNYTSPIVAKNRTNPAKDPDGLHYTDIDPQLKSELEAMLNGLVAVQNDFYAEKNAPVLGYAPGHPQGPSVDYVMPKVNGGYVSAFEPPKFFFSYIADGQTDMPDYLKTLNAANVDKAVNAWFAKNPTANGFDMKTDNKELANTYIVTKDLYTKYDSAVSAAHDLVLSTFTDGFQKMTAGMKAYLASKKTIVEKQALMAQLNTGINTIKTAYSNYLYNDNSLVGAKDFSTDLKNLTPDRLATKYGYYGLQSNMASAIVGGYGNSENIAVAVSAVTGIEDLINSQYTLSNSYYLRKATEPKKLDPEPTYNPVDPVTPIKLTKTDSLSFKLVTKEPVAPDKPIAPKLIPTYHPEMPVPPAMPVEIGGFPSTDEPTGDDGDKTSKPFTDTDDKTPDVTLPGTGIFGNKNNPKTPSKTVGNTNDDHGGLPSTGSFGNERGARSVNLAYGENGQMNGNNVTANHLPQLGDNHANVFAVLGVMLAGVMAMLGLGLKKRRQN